MALWDISISLYVYMSICLYVYMSWLSYRGIAPIECSVHWRAKPMPVSFYRAASTI